MDINFGRRANYNYSLGQGEGYATKSSSSKTDPLSQMYFNVLAGLIIGSIILGIFLLFAGGIGVALFIVWLKRIRKSKQPVLIKTHLEGLDIAAA